MMSTFCWTKERMALIWFSCFCWASEKRSVIPLFSAALCTDLVFAVRQPLSAPTWEKPMTMASPPPPPLSVPPPPLLVVVPHPVSAAAVSPAITNAEILFIMWGVSFLTCER
jgi:hypothetical protein